MTPTALTDPLNPNLTPIQQFYTKCNIFVTGGTGFLGKGNKEKFFLHRRIQFIHLFFFPVLVNKLLTSCPGIENIYLLVRNKRGKDVHSRIDEIFEDSVSTSTSISIMIIVNIYIFRCTDFPTNERNMPQI